METNARMQRLVEVLKAARLLNDFVMLPDMVNSQFECAKEETAALADATETVLEFVVGHIEIASGDVIDLTGELAAARAENAKLKRNMAQMEKASGAGVPNIPDSPPPPASAATGRLKRAVSLLPKYVERRGNKFGCEIQRKGLKFRKGGFGTAQEAHEYAVERIARHAAACGDTTRSTGNRTHGRSTANENMPRFVYKRKDKFTVQCNREKVYFCKTGFKTAAEASVWAEAEFVRKSAAETPRPDNSAPTGRRDPGRPRTRAETKAAIAESRERLAVGQQPTAKNQ